jgi:hypothetical protein
MNSLKRLAKLAICIVKGHVDVLSYEPSASGYGIGRMKLRCVRCDRVFEDRIVTHETFLASVYERKEAQGK